MKVLFITWHFGCLRNYEQTIIRLAERGHRVHLVSLASDALGGEALVARLAAYHSAITWELSHEPSTSDPFQDLLAPLRLMTDYLRYLEPAYESAPMLVQRATRRTPQGLLQLVNLPGMKRPRPRRIVRSLLRSMEEAVPRRPEIGAFLRRHDPDVVLLTPLIGLGSAELDYLEESVRLGFRTVYCVWSWDNLSSKALLRNVPDAVTVWNETQAHEAVELHGVPRDRVVVTGAQSFDQWFDRRPSRTREAFCKDVGLPDDRPFLLWVCSALFKHSPVEAAFVRRWVESIRGSEHPLLRDVAVLVRPHPSRLSEWKDVSLDDLGPTSLWGANPIDDTSKNDYFDSLYYAAAVVGLNTSAFLEAAIVGRPVFTVLLPEYFDSQEGTLHFPYLLNVAGGLLKAQRTMGAHLADLENALQSPEQSSEQSRRFVAAFIRPLGLGVNATDRFVLAVEQVGAMGRGPQRSKNWHAGVLQMLLKSALAVVPSRAVQWALLSPTEWRAAEARRTQLVVHRAGQARRRAERRKQERAERAAKAEQTRRKRKSMAQHRAAKRARKLQRPQGA